MFIATLLTNPAHPVLDRVTVESLRNAWGGGDAVWLDPGVAAEFALEAKPENLWEVWAGLQAIGVDLIVQAAAGRRKRLLIADMDSTMIQQECIDELADEAGVGADVGGLNPRAVGGEVGLVAGPAGGAGGQKPPPPAAAAPPSEKGWEKTAPRARMLS